jgi:protein-arginine kinase activator protein McsA
MYIYTYIYTGKKREKQVCESHPEQHSGSIGNEGENPNFIKVYIYIYIYI